MVPWSVLITHWTHQRTVSFAEPQWVVKRRAVQTPPWCRPAAPPHSPLGTVGSQCTAQPGCNPDSTCQWPCCMEDLRCVCVSIEYDHSAVWGGSLGNVCRIIIKNACWTNDVTLGTTHLEWLLVICRILTGYTCTLSDGHSNSSQSQSPLSSFALLTSTGHFPGKLIVMIENHGVHST